MLLLLTKRQISRYNTATQVYVSQSQCGTTMNNTLTLRPIINPLTPNGAVRVQI